MCKAQEACVVLEAPYDMEQLDKIDKAYQKTIRDFIPMSRNGYKVTFYLGETSYAFIDCRSDWFEYVNGQWENIYELDNHGFTCSSIVFVNEGLPHVYGGYGIWRGQSLNMALTPNGEWSFVTNPTMPDFYHPSAGFHYYDSSVVLIGGHYVNTAKGMSIATTDCYIVSNSGDWAKTNCAIDSSLFHFGPGYTHLSNDDFRVGVLGSGLGRHFAVQDKKTLEIRVSLHQITVEGKGVYLLQHDSISVIDNNRAVSIALIDLFNNGQLMEFGAIEQPESRWSNWYVLLLLPVFWGLLLLIRKSSSRNISQPELYNQILEKTGSSFQTNDFNQLLKLNHLSYDRIRRKRSDIIQEINHYHNEAEGKDLISRKRDPSDKRHFIFTIEK